MRCRKHLSDHSSSVGVCATCLRDKLVSLIQNQSSQPHSRPSPEPNQAPSLKPKAQPNQPPPLIFPRSVSPYVKSSRPIQRFHSTPLVGPTSTSAQISNKKQRFSLLAKLFRSRSAKPDPNFTPNPSTTSSSSFVVSNTYCSNRGMSPDRSRGEEEEEEREYPPGESPARGLHPLARPSPARPGPARRENVITLCLSPLVRAAPPAAGRHWSEKGYSGEIRIPAAGGGCSNKAQLSSAASFCKNRSRKLADLGRINRNR